MESTKGAQNVSKFQTYGIVAGKPVRITHLGDVPGNSASYLCIDANGASAWVPFAEVQIIDVQNLPLSLEAIQNLGKAAQTTGGGRR